MLDTDSGSYSLIFNNWNNGQQTPDYGIDADRDYYFDVYADHVEEVFPEVAVSTIHGDMPVTVRGGVVCANGTIRVFDLMGRQVSSGVGTLDLNTLGRGIYVVRTLGGSLKVQR